VKEERKKNTKKRKIEIKGEKNRKAEENNHVNGNGKKVERKKIRRKV
jgi:hypothetical protein